MTADLIFALISTEDLDSMNQIMIKQIKSRYSDKSVNKRFVVGMDRAKMRLYDVENSAQDGIVDSGQLKIDKAFNSPQKFDKCQLEGFKM